jgi:hypothetical protein
MVTILTRVVAVIALYVGEGFAQTSPLPGPTVPVQSLPAPKGGQGMVINPTKGECDARWRRDFRWTREEFDAACARFEVSD